MSMIRNYLTGALAGGASEGLVLAAGFANVWLLTRLLGKEEFGAYAFVTAIFGILGLLGPAGLDRLIAFRVAESKPQPGRLVGGGYASAGLLIGFGLSSLLAAAVWILARLSIDDWAGSPYGLWVVVSCLALPLQTLAVVLADWLNANRRVPEVRLLSAVRPLTNAALLVGVYLFWPDRHGAAAAFLLSTVVALVAWGTWAGLGQLRKPKRISGWEWRYGLKLAAAKLGSVGVERVDILMLGLMVSNAATAEYAVAHRLARLGGLGNRLLSPVFMPRLRYALAHDQNVKREYDQNRLFELVPALLVLSALLLAGPWLLSVFFEQHDDASALLALLALVYVAGAAFGPNGRYLNLAGHGSATVATTAILLVLTVLLNLVLIPLWGALGAAIATVLSVGLGNAIVSALILRKNAFNTFSPPVLGVACIATAAVLAWVASEKGRPLASVAVTAAAMVLMLLQRDLWRRGARREKRR